LPAQGYKFFINSIPSFYQLNTIDKSKSMDKPSDSLDERLQIAGNILKSVGISAVIWGADALIHHAMSTVKMVNLTTLEINIAEKRCDSPQRRFPSGRRSTTTS
jgi:hypothetical protein